MKELVNDEDFMIISDHIEALKLIKDKYPKITIGYILFKGDALKFYIDSLFRGLRRNI